MTDLDYKATATSDHGRGRDLRLSNRASAQLTREQRFTDGREFTATTMHRLGALRRIRVWRFKFVRIQIIRTICDVSFLGRTTFISVRGTKFYRPAHKCCYTFLPVMRCRMRANNHVKCIAYSEHSRWMIWRADGGGILSW